MSLDSIGKIGEKEFARRNLWEATLFDEKHNPLIWSTGLIKSVNTPKLSFTIDDIFAGTSKSYTGWKLPDNLSIGIWETSDHVVEKYFDEWMTGKTGVFNPGTGAFHVQPSEDYLYRDVKIKTFIYEYTEGDSYQVKKKNVVSALALAMRDGTGDLFRTVLNEQSGAVSVEQQEYIHEISEVAVNEVERIVANQHDITTVFQATPMQKVVMVEKKQVIPILDKITAAIGGLANQAVARIPLLESDITRRFIPPVVIPPPLMRVPVSTGSPIPQPPSITSTVKRLQDTIAPRTVSKIAQLQNSAPESKQKAALKIMDGVRRKVEEVLVDFAAGEASHAKRWKASEKTTSLIT
jgi:hypothetical protein